MDDNLYGKELSRYKFDYLGGHKNIDAILMNSEVILYEKGFIICSSLQKNFIYLEWDAVECIVYCKDSTEKIEIDYDEEKTITLEKIDKNINVMEMLLMVRSVSPNMEILTKVKINKSTEEALFTLLDNDLRIQALLTNVDDSNMLKVNEVWENHLNKTLIFPFTAEILDYQEKGTLHEGDKVTVLSMSEADDLYGILVRIVKNKNKYIFPLCDLEVTDNKSKNYLLVDDYSFWFANYR